jgi:hypothetical protein
MMKKSIKSNLRQNFPKHEQWPVSLPITQKIFKFLLHLYNLNISIIPTNCFLIPNEFTWQRIYSVISDNTEFPRSIDNEYSNDFHISRNNLDNKPTSKGGKLLIDLCKESGIRILNGRTNGDINNISMLAVVFNVSKQTWINYIFILCTTWWVLRWKIYYSNKIIPV